MKEYNMLKDDPGKSLLFFALPMIIGNLFQQFYNMADTIIVGKFVSEDALAAVGASYSITTVFIMIAIGGGIGSAVIISQYLGAREYEKMKTSAYTALINFFIVSIFLFLLGFFANKWILAKLKTPANIFDDASLYLSIYFMGLPFLFMYNIQSAIFNSLGKSKIPLYLLIFSSLLNIGLDLYMVIVLNMGVAGVAIATVIAQGISAIISFFILIKLIQSYETEKVNLFNFLMLRNMVTVAIPSILQQSIVSIGMVLVQSVVNSFGSSVLAGFSAANRVESLSIVPLVAMGNAMSTFSAQNLGADQVDRVKEGYKVGVKIIFAFSVGLALLIALFHNQIISIFMDGDIGSEAFLVGTSFLKFIGFFLVFLGLKSITDGVLRGAGDMTLFTIANLMNLSIRVFVAFKFAPIWGVQAIWYSIPMGWVTNFLISFTYLLTGKWQKKNIMI